MQQTILIYWMIGNKIYKKINDKIYSDKLTAFIIRNQVIESDEEIKFFEYIPIKEETNPIILALIILTDKKLVIIEGDVRYAYTKKIKNVDFRKIFELSNKSKFNLKRLDAMGLDELSFTLISRKRSIEFAPKSKEVIKKCNYKIIVELYEKLSKIRAERIKIEKEQKRREKEQKRKEFEKKQKEKGLVKFISRDRTERWGTPKQVKKWKEVEVGLSNNFADYTPYKFEKFIAELFKKMGYDVELTPPAKDYGVDVVAKKGENAIAIQVKKYAKGNYVGAKDVQQALGAMWKVKADHAIFITTSGFSVYAREQAKEAPVELWDKKILHEMVRKYYIENEG